MSEERKFVRLVRNKNKRPRAPSHLPVMPNGDLIPNIAEGSIVLISTPDLQRAGYSKIKLEIFIKNSEIEP